jgi:hypothetical protein
MGRHAVLNLATAALLATMGLLSLRALTSKSVLAPLVYPSSPSVLQQRVVSPPPLRPVPLVQYKPARAQKSALLAEATGWLRAKSRDEAVIIHALRLRNIAKRTLQETPYAKFYDSLLDAVLDDTKYQQIAAGFPVLYDTPYGAGYRKRATAAWAYAGPDFIGGIPHVDKVLSTLGELGVPLQTNIVTHDGSRLTLAAVLEDSLNRWKPERESEWSLIAYCDYLPTQRNWLSADGKTRSVDNVLETMLRRKITGACFGTHRLYSLAKACAKSHRAPGYFDPSLIREVEEQLRQLSRHLTMTQHPAGYWDPDRAGVPSTSWSAGTNPDDPRLRLVVTGHMLEWFAIADSTIRPPFQIIRRAVLFVEDELRRRPEAYYDSQYLPAATHAIRALFNLSEDSAT